VNSATGFRSIITGKTQGGGAEVKGLISVAVNKSGDIYVGDQITNSIYRVDPTTGYRTVVSSPSLGTGPSIGSPVDLAFNDTGSLIVANQIAGSAHNILEIDIATGNRATLSGADRGTGPTFQVAGRIQISGGNIFLTTGKPESSLFQIDIHSGDRKVISGGVIGSGPSFSLPSAFYVNSAQSLLVGDWDNHAIYSVDAVSGNRTLLAGSPPGSANPLAWPTSFAMSESGDFYICDRSRGILQLNLASAQFSTFSGRDSLTYGAGFRELWSMAIVPTPVPEPNAAAMLLSCIIGLHRLRRPCD